MSGWQPIETAPRNGDWFLAIIKGEYMPGKPFVPDVVTWGECPLSGHVGILHSSDEFGTEVYSDARFTHWMPLPAAPN